MCASPTIERYKVPRQATFGHPFFGEVSEAMQASNKRQLQAEDCPEPPSSDAAAQQYETLQTLWKEEVQRSKRDRAEHAALPADDPKKQKEPKPPSLQTAVWRMAKRPFCLTAGLHAIHIVLQFAGPLMLNRILQLLADIQKCDNETDKLEWGETMNQACLDKIWHGYLFAGILFITKVIEALAMCHQQMVMTRVALHIYTELSLNITTPACARAMPTPAPNARSITCCGNRPRIAIRINGSRGA